MEQVIYFDYCEGYKIIQSRIIDLTEKKIDLEQNILEYECKMNNETDKYRKETFRRYKGKCFYTLNQVERMILINQQLLCHDNNHVYQLEN